MTCGLALFAEITTRMGNEGGLVFSKGPWKCLLEKPRRVSVAAAGRAGLYFLTLSPQFRKERKTLCDVKY